MLGGWAGISRRKLLVAGAAATVLVTERQGRAAAKAILNPNGRLKTVRHDGAPTATPPAVINASTPTAALHPDFPDVSQAGPDDAVKYLAGRDSRYPGSASTNFLGYSPADILETMDTVVLDEVAGLHGLDALNTLYQIVAANVLDTLRALYDGSPLVVALDAGHGGKDGVYYDPGSNGTEAIHTRRVVAAIEQRATAAQYGSIVIRRIFNDAIGDDFGMPAPDDHKDRAQLVMRNTRGSMLAYQAGAWNSAHPDSPVSVHVVSVHFNANTKGTLVLHEGADVPGRYQALSVLFAQKYVDSVRPALNATGLLPYDLSLVEGTGLHDDTLMYASPRRSATPPVDPLTGAPRPHFPPRYAMLQGSLLEAYYVQKLLHMHGYA